MDKDLGICAREKEIKQLQEFISSHVEDKKSGILYVTGPPGTGKSMCVNLVLDRIEDQLTTTRLNCFKAQTMQVILKTICDSVNLKTKNSRLNESEMIAQLEKKFSGRTSKPHLIVLDEMDQLPKSRVNSPFKTIFSWTKQNMSKLLIIGIANTVNLTARCQALSNYAGEGYNNIVKIIFKPYSSKDIKSILNWYLENDENFEEASVDTKALDMISMKFAREKGDIRGAINALRSSLDDYNQQKLEESKRIDQFPTPPSTPPLTPCKEKTTNLASIAGSVRKRQRESHYFKDQIPASDKIVLVCLQRLCSKSKNASVDMKAFIGRAADALHKYKADSGSLVIRSALEQLESQGLLSFKKGPRATNKIVLKASDLEIIRFVPDYELIKSFIQTIVK